MKRQPIGTNKINNGMLPLIERHAGLRSAYRHGVREILKKWVDEGKPGARLYEETAIWRAVYNQREINAKSKIIKEAFLALHKELYPDLEAEAA